MVLTRFARPYFICFGIIMSDSVDLRLSSCPVSFRSKLLISIFIRFQADNYLSSTCNSLFDNFIVKLGSPI